MLLEEINLRISVECNFIQMYSWFYKIKIRESVKSYTKGNILQIRMKFFSWRLSLSLFLFLSLSFIKEKYHLYSSVTWLVSMFRMWSKSLITKKVTNECQRDLIRYLFKIQRESGETSEKKKRDKDKRDNSNDQIAGT